MMGRLPFLATSYLLTFVLCAGCGDGAASEEAPETGSPGGSGGTSATGGTTGKGGSGGSGGSTGTGGKAGSSGSSGQGGAGVSGSSGQGGAGTGATGGSSGSGGSASGAGGVGQGGSGGSGGSVSGGSGGSGGGAAVDCGAATAKGWQLCGSSGSSCEVVFDDSAGCGAVCGALGLVCAESYENADGACAADKSLPALGCATTGHKSDFCVCSGGGSCTPSCDGKSCGGDGCGGLCGTCGAGKTCQAGACADAPNLGEVLAFPGAEGEGRHSKGGRGGDVYHVTTLNDSGGGSLREGVKGSGARTIVFDVAGIITLNSPLTVSRSGLTIAGQTAPGGGIVVRGYQTLVKADDVVIRHMRFRAGDIKKKSSKNGEGFTEDSITLQGQDIIVDHVSASWGIDESLSGGSSFDRLTVQYSIVAEGLKKTCLFHGEYDCSHPGHSMGSLFKPQDGDARFTIHHTLYYSNNNRNPAIGTYQTTQSEFVDIRNNVIYNCPTPGYSSGMSKKIELNYIGNYLIWGPESEKTQMFEADPEDHLNVFQEGNFRDTNKNGSLDGKVGGWDVIAGSYSKASAPFKMEPVTTHPAPEALAIVLEQSGAMPWKRDEVDTRIVNNVKSGKGKMIDSQDDVGGWGTIEAGKAPPDSDGDGMPDSWETASGTDPQKADNNGDIDGDGYTNLEAYLHERANPLSPLASPPSHAPPFPPPGASLADIRPGPVGQPHTPP